MYYVASLKIKEVFVSRDLAEDKRGILYYFSSLKIKEVLCITGAH